MAAIAGGWRPARRTSRATGHRAPMPRSGAHVPAAFEQRLAEAVRGRPFAARRVFVRYAPAASRADRAAAIAAVERAGGIVAWSQSEAAAAPEAGRR